MATKDRKLSYLTLRENTKRLSNEDVPQYAKPSNGYTEKESASL